MAKAKKNKLAAVLEYGIDSPQAQRMRMKRRRARLALQGIDLDAMLKEKAERKKALLAKIKSPVPKTKKEKRDGTAANSGTDKG